MKMFITGGSRGIGHNIMTAALKKGYDVAFTYLNHKTNTSLIIKNAKEIAPDCICKAYHLDVSQPKQVEDVVNRVALDFDDEIDVVINNAGINKNNLLFHMSDEEWHDVLNTNLTGSFYIAKQFLPIFLARRKGRFISISSIAKDGISGQANYSASKAGLVGLSGAIAKEYGQKGITSNVVVPGFYDTDMTQQTMSDELKKFWIQHCHLKRMGKLEELSATVMFLASDEASFINGQVISVTGGLDWSG